MKYVIIGSELPMDVWSNRPNCSAMKPFVRYDDAAEWAWGASTTNMDVYFSVYELPGESWHNLGDLLISFYRDEDVTDRIERNATYDTHRSIG